MPVLPAFIDGPCVESSYISRKPLKSQPGRDLNTAESHILTLAEKNESLSVSVVCTGTLFGHGEYFFAPFFREAWMCERSVRCLDSASNRIPTLHVQDAVSIVRNSMASCAAVFRYVALTFYTTMPCSDGPRCVVVVMVLAVDICCRVIPIIFVDS